MEDSFDPSLNILFRRQSSLDKIFEPKTVAVVGATENEGSVGRTLMQNLLKGPFKGEVFPVNPKRDTVLGVKAYKDIKSLPKGVDLAVIATPAKTVPQIIADCSETKIPAAVIISAGFKEMGEPGILLEEEILKAARQGKMRIVGPNCLGVMNPNVGFNATFAADIALKGKIAFISQSGALCTAVLDWSLREKVGFSAFVSIGSMIDVDFGDLINYFGNDPWTESILIYMESIGDARSFLSAAREVALTKPIILIKAGRSLESAKAAASHTGALSGSDEVLSAALKRVGVLRVDTIADLFGMAEILAKQPRPKGPHLTIVTNAGGPGVIATDALIEGGGKLASLSAATKEALNQILPPQWSRNNPVDILGDAGPETYRKTVEIVANDPNTEAVLVILTPQDMTDPTATAEKLKDFSHQEKPILASWMGANSVAKGGQILASAKIPTFEYPDMACRAFSLMWRYSDDLKGIYEVPSPALLSTQELFSKKQKVAAIIDQAQKEGRTLLDEVESKEVLNAYGIPTVSTSIATTADEAAKKAKELKFPVVLKLYSKTITHKTDVGGVKLNLANEEAVRKAFDEIYASLKKLHKEEHFQGVTVQPMIKLEGYELILGCSLDEQFGPVLLFGSGGQLVEVYKDRSLAIPPLTTTLAKRMMETTKVFEALKGVRGRKKVDLEKLAQILVQFSDLIVNESRIKEFDINPLLASPENLIALDARIILHDAHDKKPPRLAIRPYPIQYAEVWHLKDKTPIFLRPIRPEDEPLLVKFHKDLSQEAVRQRYLKSLHYQERVSHDRLVRICFNDYDREIAIVAERKDPEEILGVIRLTRLPGANEAVFAMIVKDAWQNRGIGRKLLEKILLVAKNEKIERISAQMLPENVQMKKLCENLGFRVKEDKKLLFAEINI